MTASAEFPVPERPDGWLSSDEIAQVAPLDAASSTSTPSRCGSTTRVTSIAVGLLLRVTREGVMSRALISGRVMYHERVRDALVRHIEKDLGPVALPQIPASPQPFTVAEYFPTPGITAYHDPRQHAVSLAYVVPVLGDCLPQHDAIDLAWLTPEEACAEQVQVEMNGGQGVLLRQAMAHVGRL